LLLYLSISLSPPICPFVCLSLSPSVCPCVCPSTYVTACHPMCLAVCLSALFCLSLICNSLSASVFVGLSVCVCVSLSAHVSVLLLVSLPTCLSVSIRFPMRLCLRLRNRFLSACVSVGLLVHQSDFLCLSVCLSMGLSVCLCVYLSVCLSAYLSVCLFVCLPFCVSVRGLVCLCVCLLMFVSVYLCVCVCPSESTRLSTYVAVRQPMCLSICLYISVPLPLSVCHTFSPPHNSLSPSGNRNSRDNLSLRGKNHCFVQVFFYLHIYSDELRNSITQPAFLLFKIIFFLQEFFGIIYLLCVKLYFVRSSSIVFLMLLLNFSVSRLFPFIILYVHFLLFLGVNTLRGRPTGW
jgi:hypothetical protein